MSSLVGLDVYAGGVAWSSAIHPPTGAGLQPPWETVWVNEFAPANAMVGIADKSAPTSRGDLRPYRRSGFIRETKTGVPTFSFPSSHRSAV